jgi:hypothetical protein
MINMTDGDSANSPSNERDIIPLNVPDHHNALLGQEMQSQLVHTFPQNAFLNQ